MNTFSDNSRVWIYQSDRELTAAETNALQNKLDAFAQEWTAHDNLLKAKAEVKYNRFIILTVDESQYGASGCSIDKSVRLMKEIEHEFVINLFDRFNIAYKKDQQVHSVNREEFEKLLTEGVLNDQTIVFNNLVKSQAELAAAWEIPLKDSWHNQVFASALGK